VRIPHSAAYNGTATSFFIWIYPTGNLTYQKRIADRAGPTWVLGTGNGTNYLAAYIGNATRATSAADIYDFNVWQQVGFTYDKNAASDQVKLYKNGQLLQVGTLTTFTMVGTQDLILGATNTGTYVFPGNMCHAQIWNRALTPAEIAEMYQRSK
jgi:hypothetical protein